MRAFVLVCGIAACAPGGGATLPTRADTHAAGPDQSIDCHLTTRIVNQTEHTLRTWIDGRRAAAVVPGGTWTDIEHSYRSTRDGYCSRTSVEVVARIVKATKIPGWFIFVPGIERDPLLDYFTEDELRLLEPDRDVQEPVFFRYRLTPAIEWVPAADARYWMRADGQWVTDDTVRLATATITNQLESEPVEHGELDVLLRQLASLSAELDRARREIDAYRDTIAALTTELNSERSARLQAEAARDEALAMLDQARRELEEVPTYVRQDLERNQVSTASVEWAVTNTADAMREQGDNLCHTLVEGGASIGTALLLPQLKGIGKFALAALGWMVGDHVDAYVEDLASYICD